MPRFPLSRAFQGLAARTREAAGSEPPPAPRPPGPLVWAHVAGPCDMAALPPLARALAAEAPGLTLLVTAPETAPEPPPPGGTGEAMLLAQAPPAEGRGPARRFLDHWRPDAALWLGGTGSPALMTAAAETCPLTLLGAGQEALTKADRASRTALRGLAELWLPSEGAARAARAAGVSAGRIRISPPLTATPEAPPCVESDRAELAETLAARPVWLAARPLAAELPAVLAAHRAARAIAHRALLLLIPGADLPGDAALADHLRAEGFSAAARAGSDCGEPADLTEIYLTDRAAPEEDGLWFRLAPFCFLGGTLAADGPVQDFAPAAALGSAILFGPRGGAYGPGMARLATAGAARALPGPGALAGAVCEMLSPDRAAELAHAAWVATSEGAEVTARLAAHLLAQLSGRGAV